MEQRPPLTGNRLAGIGSSRYLLTCCAVVAVCSSCAGAAQASGGEPSAVTSRGSVVGIVDGDTEAFLGVPFAEPPIGPLRFLPAQPKKPWSPKTLMATQFAKACWQGDNNTALYSEDCLSLNLWRPLGTKPGAKLPVMVFIHGGAFYCGGVWSNESVALGDVFASRQNVIVATIAYRLGPLGFLAAEELITASGGRGNGGMNGILDQITALRFLQQELEAFGGDPQSVTVMGESAGGQSVTALLVSKEAKGLFRSAVIESGAAAYSHLWRFGSYEAGLLRGKLLMAVQRCKDIECLRKVPAQDLVFTPGGGLPFPKFISVLRKDELWTQAWMDDFVLPRNAVVGDLLKDRANLNVDQLMLGVNANDGVSVYYPVVPPFWTNNSFLYDVTVEAWWDIVNHLPGWFPGLSVGKTYPLSSFGGNALAAHVQADGDYTVTCPTLQLARAVSALAVPTYLFMYSHNSPADLSRSSGWQVPDTWASHGAEVPMVFGRPGAGVKFTSVDYALSAAMQDFWGGFVRNGTPNAGNVGVTWPEFKGALGAHMAFLGTGPVQAADFRFALCDFWEKYLRPKTMRGDDKIGELQLVV